MNLLQFSSTVLFVSDIQKSADFYRNVLGLEVEHDFGKNVAFYGGIALWEIQTNHPIKEILCGADSSQRFELYFETTDINHVLFLLKENQIELLHEVHEEQWGQKTIRFFDPDRHLIEVGENMQVFVKNLKLRGLDTDEIAHKTGIDLATVRKFLSK